MKFNGNTFIDQELDLDNNAFEDCVLINCTLKYSGGKPPSIIGCSIDNPKIVFSGQAANIINFIKIMYHGGFHEIIEQTFTNIRKK